MDLKRTLADKQFYLQSVLNGSLELVLEYLVNISAAGFSVKCLFLSLSFPCTAVFSLWQFVASLPGCRF